MRIISQNGAIDVPYEHTTLIREGTEIYLSSIKLRDTLIAKYSTEEKAIKAMEMCREKYSQCEFNKLVIPKTDENLAKVSISLTIQSIEYSGNTGAAKFFDAWFPNIKLSSCTYIVISSSVLANALAFLNI